MEVTFETTERSYVTREENNNNPSCRYSSFFMMKLRYKGKTLACELVHKLKDLNILKKKRRRRRKYERNIVRNERNLVTLVKSSHEAAREGARDAAWRPPARDVASRPHARGAVWRER